MVGSGILLIIVALSPVRALQSSCRFAPSNHAPIIEELNSPIMRTVPHPPIRTLRRCRFGSPVETCWIAVEHVARLGIWL
jgi:hypothetical protein